MNIQGRGGDRAHEATTVLSREAYFAAGDATKFPRADQRRTATVAAEEVVFHRRRGSDCRRRSGGSGGGRGGPGGRGGGGRGATTSPSAAAPAPASAPGGARVTRVNTAVYDSLLGRTYAEIGADAHSYHKCQGTNGLPALPGFSGGGGGGMGGTYQLVDCKIPGQMGKDETSLFDGVDTSLLALAQFAAPNPPAALSASLAAIVDQAVRAQRAFESGNDAATAAPIEAGLAAVRALRAQLASMPLDDTARHEIDFRLKLKERDYEDAVLAAHGVTFDAVADDGLVVAGQSVRLSLLAVNRGASEISRSATWRSPASRTRRRMRAWLRFRWKDAVATRAPRRHECPKMRS